MSKIETINHDSQAFPFRVQLSLDKVIDFWKDQQSSDKKPLHHLADKVMDLVNSHPEIKGPITEATIDKYREDLIPLMTAAFSIATWEHDLRGMIAPFQSECFFETPRFTELIQIVRDGHFNDSPEQITEALHYKILYAYLFILERVYGRKIDIGNGMIIKIKDPVTKLSKHYGAMMNPTFVEVRTVGEVPELTDQDVQELLKNIENLDFWMEKLPPEHFEFYGATIIELVDITEQQSESAIKEVLLNQEALLSKDKFRSIEEHFRSLFQRQEVKIAMAAYHPNKKALINFGGEHDEFMFELDSCLTTKMEQEEYFDRIFNDRQPLIIDNVEEALEGSPLLEKFKEVGISSIMIIPLVHDNQLVGIFEAGSPEKCSFSTLDALKIKDLLPVLTVAVQRALDEIDNEVTEVIKNNFTALHPAVEWKFQEVALNYLDDKFSDRESTIDSIVFKDVYPLYGAADIRHSSDERNKAIQADLSEHLGLIRKVFSKILKKYPFPIYRELDFEANTHLQRIKTGLVSDDEVLISEMINQEIEPLFKHIQKIDKGLKEDIENYFAVLDEEHRVIYKERKKFEKSVAEVNRVVYNLIEREEEKTQSMFPYYFENYKTDGVEYNIYIGQSLVKNKEYNPIYLYNLRLWQLMVMCKVAREVNDLKPSLPIELDTCQLILAHSTPLSIKFRTDEKKFDVDGAYNIRYEIMKKRIDKAMIKDSDERLTQPGTVSIVYSSQKEEEEYMDYIRYLAHLHYIDPTPEKYDLENLQGVSGLKAIRLNVNLSDDASIEESFKKELMEVIAPYSE